MAKKNKKDSILHKFGKYTGYNVLPDGSIEIADTYRNEFEILGVEGQAIEDLISAATASLMVAQRSIVARNRDLWDRIMDDLGLPEKPKGYSCLKGIIREIT